MAERMSDQRRGTQRGTPLRQGDGRVPPHNVQAEESLLGALLLSRDAIGVAAELGLEPGDFYKPAHQHIYEAIKALSSAGQPVDTVTVGDELRRVGLLDEIGGMAALLDLQNATPAISNAGRYANIVQDTAMLRRLIGVASQIAEIAYDEPDDVTKALDEAETKVFEVAERRVTDSTRQLSDLLSSTMDQLQDTFERGSTITGVPTGYHDLDELLSGLQPSTLVIVGARPAMGKCIAWDTPVPDPVSGEVLTAAEVYRRTVAGWTVHVHSLDDAGSMVVSRITAALDDGQKPVYRVRTASGRSITLTAAHPLLTGRGWQALCDVSVGDLVAVPTHGTDVHADDLVPNEAWADLDKARGERSWVEVSALVGTPAPVPGQVLHRGEVARAAAVLDAPWLSVWYSADVRWDTVVAIDPCGVDQVYDFTVEGTHNFVASGLYVHNSAFGLGIATNVAQASGLPVLFFSLEMGHAELAQRILSAEARVDSQKLRTGRLNEADWSKIGRAIGRLEVPLHLDDNPSVTVMEIRAKARRLKARYGGLGLIVVDYLQLMQGRTSAENRQLEVSEISRNLKILARELEVPVVALSQLSRNLETRADKRPMLADLRESGSLEQDADVVMFIYRDEVYHAESPDKGSAEVIVAKHRSGPIGTRKLVFLGPYTRFDNAARGM
jgi:replicative DNA helicase